MNERSERLASLLFDCGAIKFGEFRLKLHEKNPNAPLSPIYIDLRVLRSFPQAFRAALDVYEEILKGLRFDLLADVPTAASPFVGALADRMEVPMVSPRKDEKTHGLSSKMDGAFKADQHVVLIDDLVTQADSKLEAAAVLQKAGLIVKDVVVLLDREQGGPSALLSHGLACHAAMTLTELLANLSDSGKVTVDQLRRVNDYREHSG